MTRTPCTGSSTCARRSSTSIVRRIADYRVERPVQVEDDGTRRRSRLSHGSQSRAAARGPNRLISVSTPKAARIRSGGRIGTE